MKKLNRSLWMLRASGRTRTVLTILVGGLVTVILLAMLHRNHASFERELTATFQRHQLTTAYSLSAGVEEVFAEIKDDLRALARHRSIYRGAPDGQGHIDAHYETHTDILNNITVVDAEGNRIFRSPKTPKKHNVSKWPEFLEVKQTRKPWIGEPAKCVIDTTETVVRIFAPVIENGRFNGAIYASINLKKLWAKCIKHIETGRKSLCWVVEDDGQLLHHANSEYVDLTWEQIEDKWHSSGKAARREIDDQIEELERRVRKRVQDGEEGTAEYVNSLEGVEEMVAFTPIRLGNERYGLAVVTPKSEISGPIDAHAKVTYGLMAGLAALRIAGGYLVYRGGRAGVLLAEERKYANALRESEQKYHHLFENLVDAAFLADPETGLIVETNQQGQKLLGRTRDEIVGMHQSALHPSDKAEHYKRQFAEHVHKGRALDAEAEVVRKDGTTVPVWISASTMTIGGHRLMLGIFHDITERKRADEDLKRSEHELGIRNRIAEIFLTVPDEEVYGGVLRVVLAAMDSKYGTFGYIDEDGALVVPSMTRDIWDKCQVPDKKIVYPRETWGDSAWPRAIREKRTVYSNEPSTTMPEGHIPITRNIVVPIIHAGDVVGILHVANKDTDYTQEDIRLLETIGDTVAPVLNARLQRDSTAEALRESTERFRTLIEQAADAMFVIDMEGRILDTNRQACQSLGYTHQELLKLRISDVDTEVVSYEHQKRFWETVAPGQPATFEGTQKRKDGTTFPVEIRLGILQAAPEKTMIGLVRDITDRKQAEEERNKLVKAIETTREAINITDADAVIIYANDAVDELFGYEKGELIGKHASILNIGTPQQAKKVAKEITHAIRKNGVWEGEIRNRRKDGTEFITLAKISALTNEQGEVINYVSTQHDITERKRTEEAVKRSQKELRALAARLQTAREEERAGLARRIHDDLGHILAALKMDLAWLGGRLAKASDNLPRELKITERIESMSGLLDETIQIIRQTASELRPGLLDDVGLGAAIEWQAEEFQRRTGVKCTFTNTAEDVELDHEQSTALFRICQELLTNVARHAGATAVNITLERQSDELVLEVSDNGKGIKEEQISSSMSLGILGMRERTLVLGGEFSITGQDGKGTTATVRIPLGPARRKKGD